MKNLNEEMAELKAMVDGALPDAEKAQNGNHQAGVRVRKAMQEIKGKAQEIRVAVLELNPERDAVNAVKRVGKEVGGPGSQEES